jgi:hypothetical protein
MDYTIEIKKLRRIDGPPHLLELLNYELLLYLKHGNKIVKAEMVENPIEDLNTSLNKLKEGVDMEVHQNTYKLI